MNFSEINRNVDNNTSRFESQMRNTNSVTYFILLSLILIISIGNIMVLLSLCLSQARSSRIRMFIINLAVADLLVAWTAILPQLIWTFTVYFLASDIVCKLMKYVQVSVNHASAYALVAMSIDRMEAIVRPFKIAHLSSRSLWLIIGGWIISFLCGIPTPLDAKVCIIGFTGRQCNMLFKLLSPRVYMSYMATSAFFLPALIIAISHFVICLKVINASHFQRGQTAANRVIFRAKLKSIKMTIIIVAAFILSWSTYMFWNLLTVYKVISIDRRTAYVSKIIQNLSPLNSAVNPVIYFTFNSIKRHREINHNQINRTCRSSCTNKI